MSRWQKDYEDHEIWKTIDSIKVILNTKVDTLKEDYEEEKRRILKFLLKLEECLNNFDSEFFPIGIVNQINSSVLKHQSFLNQLKQFNQDKNTAHLTNANNHLSTHMHLVVPLFTQRDTPAKKQIKSVEEQFRKFIKLVDEHNSSYKLTLDQLRNHHDKILLEIDQYKSEIVDKEKEITDLSDQFKTQFTDNQNARNEDFSKSQIEREKNYDEWRKSFELVIGEETKNLITKHDTEIQDTFDRFKAKVQKYHDISQDTHHKILELYELVANDSVKAGYMKNSQEERIQANLWRWISIGFIVIAVGWICFTYFNDFSSNIANTYIMAKILKAASLGGILIYGAVYASRQSTMHRNNEKSARQFALEISALDPFISSLDEEKQKEIKEKMTEKMFGNAHSESEKSDHIDLNVVTTITKSIADILKVK